MPPITNPVLLDLPDHFETERLILRVTRAGDGAAVDAAMRESAAELRRFMSWAHPLPTLEQTEARMRENAAYFILRDPRMDFSLWRRDAPTQFLGLIGLMFFDWQTPKCDIGYWIRTRASGQGYMTEAVRGLTGYAFTHLQMERIEIWCDAENIASAKVARKAGYTQDSHQRGKMRGTHGELVDFLGHSMLRAEWQARQRS